MKYLHVTGLIIFLFFSTTKLLAQAVINTGFVAGHMSTCNGSESEGQEIQYFTISASGLTDNITGKISPGFELSLDEFTGFSGSIVIPQNNGTASYTVYVRLTGSNGPGIVTGSATFTSTGAAAKSVTVTGTVVAPPTVDAVGNQALLNGDSTTPINFTGTGNNFTWVNDTPSIGLAANGADSIPSFIAVNNGTTPVTAKITVTPGLQELAYVTIPDSNCVALINTLTDKVSTNIKSGGLDPGPEVLSPDYDDLYVVNTPQHGGGNVVKINTATNAVLNTYPVNNGSYIVLSPDGSTIYLATFGNVYVIKTIDNQIVTKIPVGDASFEGLAMSPVGDRVYVSSSLGKIYVINTATNMVTTTLTNVVDPGLLRVNPDGSILYAANAPVYPTYSYTPNTLYVINTANYETTAKLSIGTLPGRIAMSPDGKRLYISTHSVSGNLEINGQIYIVNTTDNSIAGTIGDGIHPEVVAVSPDGSRVYVANAAAKTVSVINTSNNSIITNIPVKGNPAAVTVAFGGCEGTPITFTITVNPAPLPAVNTTNNLTALNTIYGTASASTTFTLSGTALRAGVLVTAPKGFEVSTDNTNFSKTVTVGAAGDIASTTVYIRLAATTPVGSYSGNIVLSSRALQPINVAMPLSTVSPAPLTITADNQFKIYGQPNPPLTVSYMGFVNNDGPAQLTSQVVISTIAGISSPPGKYPIFLVKEAVSSNYTITFEPGVLTITHGLTIPNTFTPNGDGINDTWEIQNLSSYPNCSVTVFNRYGEIVYSSTGYGKSWDGTYKGNGSALPAGAYYYIINLKTGVDVYSGFVLIVR